MNKRKLFLIPSIQYRKSGININIQIKKSGDFFRAEEQHQRYFMKNKINFHLNSLFRKN